ncbi:MAG TPA: diacylglycerol kinase family protein [Halanaerobiales bacterium]|nr:diacylglycerol kinase family protein [Halanaerobiales bacterium]HPZ62942.1 diacylglycerol kinase family protein [Halanaerobiales bacterium]HQD04153.1 diacylglycerol kinase family protein [Halanaerobiales bacterium]
MNIVQLMESFKNAFAGLKHTLKTQRNMRIHFIIAILALLLSAFLKISRTELLMVFFSIFLVISMELFNTAVEIIIDMISSEYNIRAKIVKNVSAAAVLVAAFNAVIVAYLVFLDKLIQILKEIALAWYLIPLFLFIVLACFILYRARRVR